LDLNAAPPTFFFFPYEKYSIIIGKKKKGTLLFLLLPPSFIRYFSPALAFAGFFFGGGGVFSNCLSRLCENILTPRPPSDIQGLVIKFFHLGQYNLRYCYIYNFATHKICFPTHYHAEQASNRFLPFFGKSDLQVSKPIKIRVSQKARTI